MSTGRISEISYHRCVWKKITDRTEGILPGVEAADMALKGVTVAMSSACILKWFDGCEEYYLQKAINSLSEKAAIVRFVQLEINIPFMYEEKLLGRIIKNFNDSAKARKMTVSQCRVYQGEVAHPIAHITVYGETKYCFSRKNIESGMNVVMAGSIAIGGTAVISQIYRKKLEKKFTQTFVENCIQLKEHLDVTNIVNTAIKNDEDITAIHSVSDGGVFGAIWEIASSAGLGIEVDILSIPVWQETVEVAELFDYNPYLIDGTGAVLFVTRNGKKLAQKLNGQGIYADVIGTINKGKDRVAVRCDEKRYLEPPRGDELYRFIS